MKKGVLLTLCLVVIAAYFYQKGAPKHDEQEDIQEQAQDSLSHVKKSVTAHQVKILTKALKKETVQSQSFKDFISNTKTAPVKDSVFLKQTFETLLDCYQEGCGEEPDHEGYYNEAQTVAASTINRILEENLNESSPDWMNENDLLDLFSSKNAKTRSLAFQHLMKRGDQATQINKILDQTQKLNDYNTGDVFKNLVPLMNQENSEAIIGAVTNVLSADNQSPLAKDETLTALMKAKGLSKSQVEMVADSSCKGLGDINNKNSTIYKVETIAKNSGHALKLTEYCQ